MKILFVCTGNTCRSLMAEGYARKLIQDYGLNGVEAASCGTYANPGYAVPKVVIRMLKDEGVDVSGHMSTPVTKQLLESSDLILTMEKGHAKDITSLFPAVKAKVHLFNAYAGEGTGRDVPDPIGRSDEVYGTCFEEIKAAQQLIFDKLFRKDAS